MTPAEQDIGAFLVAQGVATLGQVFYGALPASELSPDQCLAIIPRPGLKPEQKYGVTTVAYDKPAIQILVRGPREDYAAARTMAFAAYEALGAVQAQTINGSFYHAANLAGAPGYVGEDGNRRPLFALNLVPEREPG